MSVISFNGAELKLFDEIQDATTINIDEWNYRYSIPKTRREKERADEWHWEATMRYYFSKKIHNPLITFKPSNRGADLTERDCSLLTGTKFTAELRYTYHNPPSCWNVFTPSRIRQDTSLYLILLPNDGQWDNRRRQGFPDLKKKVGICSIKLETLSGDVALAMVKLPVLSTQTRPSARAKKDDSGKDV